MDMQSMSMPMGATSTMSGMPMATSSVSSSSSMPMMGMDMMEMVFFHSVQTPLWSSAFSPKTAGQYAGVCIFLIVLTTVFRALLALRINFFDILDAARRRRGVPLLEQNKCEGDKTTRPWRAGEMVMIAAMDVVVAGISYLLMLAVMTMNVGYFLSILGGVFVGSMLCGRWTGRSGAH